MNPYGSVGQTYNQAATIGGIPASMFSGRQSSYLSSSVAPAPPFQISQPSSGQQFIDVSAQSIIDASNYNQRASGVTVNPVFPSAIVAPQFAPAANLPSMPTRAEFASGTFGSATGAPQMITQPVTSITTASTVVDIQRPSKKIVNTVQTRNTRDYYPVESTMLPIRCSCGFVFHTRDPSKGWVSLEEAIEQDLKSGQTIQQIMIDNKIIKICCTAKVVEAPFVNKLMREAEKMKNRTEMKNLTLAVSGPDVIVPLLRSGAFSMRVISTNDTRNLQQLQSQQRADTSIVDEEGNIIEAENPNGDQDDLIDY
ncbi:MAG: hypothetical protein Solivirus7_11 [Solivirus sp.]|uniref:Uncharacterized protein n=1 Tax=Solivirus sp. TaxID=2487772 RepID=A0A3G5AJK2_9VIRU|nr:MAG: hypothetical protein Solivirus7_11 [Solivirus sp.]